MKEKAVFGPASLYLTTVNTLLVLGPLHKLTVFTIQPYLTENIESWLSFRVSF